MKTKNVLMILLLVALIFVAGCTIDGNVIFSFKKDSCSSNQDCKKNRFCDYEACSTEWGTCQKIPNKCLFQFFGGPVCSCDGKTYANDCERKQAQVSKAYDEKCKCGDGICGEGESCESCGDCGACPPICGNNICEGDENCSVCPSDCGACFELELQKIIGETVVSPLDARYGRAEIIIIDNRIFSAFNNLDTSTFQLVELNEDLSHKSPVNNIFSDSTRYHKPTDIRLASDGRNLWYAFESVKRSTTLTCDSHFLNIAKYDISGTNPILNKFKLDIARGCPTTREGYLNPPAEIPETPEAVDDPTPLFHNGKYIVLTRAWKGGIQHIRTFGQDFNLIEHFTLDLSSILNGRLLSQNALVNINGQIYLIGGLFDGPPINPNSNSDIYAVPLSGDLHSVSSEIIPLLKHQGEYFAKVTAARYDQGKLYINYAKAENGEQFQHLAVFDVDNNFTLITKTQFQDNSVPINHASMDIFANKVYVAYQEKEYEIVGKVFEWKEQEELPNYEDSPFGIFNPYITIFDSPGVISMSDINSHLIFLGVKWVQGMPGKAIDDYATTGVNIYSRALPIGGEGYPPGIHPDYENQLREIIREYKDTVKYWEVDTEPGGVTGWKGHPIEYAEFLKVTYETIKEECSNCKVVFGGLPGSFEEINESNEIALFLDSVLEVYGAKYFDYFEFKVHHHDESQYIPLIKNRMEVFGEILLRYNVDIKEMPVFIETAMYDGTPKDPFRQWPTQSEKLQAKGLIKTYVFALSRGIDKIFWNLIMERSSKGPQSGVFQNYGLIHHPDNDGNSNKKLSYYTYKLMVEKLDGSDWDNMETVQESDNVYIYKFMKQGKPIWVVWNDGTERQITISGINSDSVKITEAVPKYETGQEVIDYKAAFNTEIKTVNNGQVSLILGIIPVFVEGEAPPVDSSEKNCSDYVKPHSYLIVHAEPEKADTKHFEGLERLVKLANSYNVKLTILFSPQWIELIQSLGREEEVISWVNNQGHELGFHHHGIQHRASWDGFTNLDRNQAEEEYNAWIATGGYGRPIADSFDEVYRGNMDDYYEVFEPLYSRLSKGAKIATFGIGKTEEWDWICKIPYNAAQFRSDDGSRPPERNALSVPRELPYNLGNCDKIIGISMGGYTPENKQQFDNLFQYYSALYQTEDAIGQGFGLVFHVFNFVETYDPTTNKTWWGDKTGEDNPVEKWFMFLNDQDPNGCYQTTPSSYIEEYLNTKEIGIERIKSFQLTTASDGYGARPEIVSNGEFFYIIYLGNITTNRKFKVRIYNSDFNLIKEKVLVSSNPKYGSPTDIRASKDGNYVYAFFELGSKITGAHLFGAKYRMDENFTMVAETISPITESVYYHDSQDGDELLDDPASVVVDGKPFVMTKIRDSGKGLENGSTLYVIRELSPDLSRVIEKKNIDLSEVMNGWAYLNNLFYVNDKIHHIQPTITSFSPKLNFDLVLLRFDKQWSYENSIITLTDTPDIEGMPTGARFTDSLLFLSYRVGEVTPVGEGTPTSPGELWLNIYNNSFKLIDRIKASSEGLVGEHSTLEVIGDYVYVAYGAKKESEQYENVYLDIFQYKK